MKNEQIFMVYLTGIANSKSEAERNKIINGEFGVEASYKHDYLTQRQYDILTKLVNKISEVKGV